MSNVLMCDSCSELFSVNETGWRQFEESITVMESNPHNHGKRIRHMCRNCIPVADGGSIRPRIAIDK